jgi:hypothetical protein
MAMIPLLGGLAFVVFFGVSIAFPAARDHWLFTAAAYAVAVAIFAHPLWAFIHLITELIGERSPRP